MFLSFTNAEKWYEHYEYASKKQHYEVLLQTIEQPPEFYKKEFHYYDDFLVTYHLFRDDSEKVTESLLSFSFSLGS